MGTGLTGPWAQTAAILGIELLALKVSPQEVLTSFEPVWKKSWKKLQCRLRPQLLGAAIKLRLSPFVPACTGLQPCLCQVTYPGWSTPWLTNGLDVPAWHWSCLITMDLSGNLGWIWSWMLGLLCSLCSGTVVLLLLSEWHLAPCPLSISLPLLLLHTYRIF